ncbi:MAG: hypothetical protein B7Y35_13930 [Sphingomonadales bacterium 28-64-96]|nr:MAG: hypothetical protein B7Y35_13930 [Sphingomonadales bacterium 28-64-96]
MRRLLCLILAAVLMVSHGTMGAAVPHAHVQLDGGQHHAEDADHQFSEANALADHDGKSGQDGDADSDAGVPGHVHLVAGLDRVSSTGDLSRDIISVAPLPAAMRQLVSREVAPLLEPPTP